MILTDSWLMPGRWGTTGVALATAGFRPIQDERGKIDLFGNPMQVTQRGIADTICAAAELVMGERDEATAVAIVRNAGVELTDAPDQRSRRVDPLADVHLRPVAHRGTARTARRQRRLTDFRQYGISL